MDGVARTMASQDGGEPKKYPERRKRPLKRTGERLRRHSAVPFSPRSVHETEYLDAIQGYFDLKKKNIIVKETNLCILFWRFMIRSETAQRPASREFPGVLPA